MYPYVKTNIKKKITMSLLYCYNMLSHIFTERCHCLFRMVRLDFNGLCKMSPHLFDQNHFLLVVNFAVIILWLNHQLGCKVKWEMKGKDINFTAWIHNKVKWMCCCRRWPTVVGWINLQASLERGQGSSICQLNEEKLIDKQFHWGSGMCDGAVSPAGDYAALLP